MTFVDFIYLMVYLDTFDMGILDELKLDNKAHQIKQQTSFGAFHQKYFALFFPPQFGQSISAKTSNVTDDQVSDRHIYKSAGTIIILKQSTGLH